MDGIRFYLLPDFEKIKNSSVRKHFKNLFFSKNKHILVEILEPIWWLVKGFI